MMCSSVRAGPAARGERGPPSSWAHAAPGAMGGGAVAVAISVVKLRGVGLRFAPALPWN
jgi:hypothetical protein